MTDEELGRLRTRVHAITRPEKGLLLIYFLGALLTCFMFPIVFRRELPLTCARMQDTHLSQNILERPVTT